MAPSWSELSADQKNVFSLESSAQKQDQQTSIACSLCNQIFFDNRSLVNHFQSHFHRDGTSNPRPFVGSSVSQEIGARFFSSSSRYTHSVSVPMNVCTIASENLEPCVRQNVSPRLSQVPMQLRGPTLTHRPQSYPSPLIFHSAISHGTFASQPNQSSNFHSRLASQYNGPQNFCSPIGSTTPCNFTSQTTQPSNFHFPMNAGACTSQTIQKSSFCPPRKVGVFASQSIPGTYGALGTARYLSQTAMSSEVEGCFTGYAKPYIMQLEQPIEEMVAALNDKGGDCNPDEVDLILKL